jgi:hypothetical protein
MTTYSYEKHIAQNEVVWWKRMRIRYLHWKIAFVVLILASLTIPVPKVFVEDWSVRVTDQNDHPVPNIRVSRGWENYTFNLGDGGELYTDDGGTVSFPKQRQFRPTTYWVAMAAWNLLHLGVHASLGTVSTVRVSDSDREWSIDPTGRWPASAICSDAECNSSKLHSELRILLVEAR